jgi:hypothetical protein
MEELLAEALRAGPMGTTVYATLLARTVNDKSERAPVRTHGILLVSDEDPTYVRSCLCELKRISPPLTFDCGVVHLGICILSTSIARRCAVVWQLEKMYPRTLIPVVARVMEFASSHRFTASNLPN